MKPETIKYLRLVIDNYKRGEKNPFAWSYSSDEHIAICKGEAILAKKILDMEGIEYDG